MPQQITWNGSQWTDANGQPVDVSKLPIRQYGVTLPSEVPAKVRSLPQVVGGMIKQSAAPIAAQYAGQTAGEAIGALAPPPFDLATIPIGGAIAAGLANVGTSKYLPKEYGGNPDESAKAAFLWGSLPTLAGSVGAEALKARAASKVAEAGEKASEEFEQAATTEAERQRNVVREALTQPTEQGTINRTLRGIGVEASGVPEMGAERTAATNEAVDAFMGPVNRMREKIGAPLGEAYKSLKNLGPITPEEAQSLGQATQTVQENLIAPAPAARNIFNRLRNWLPTDESLQVAESPFESAETLRGQGTKAQRFLTFSQASPEQAAKLQALADARPGGKLEPEDIAAVMGGGKPELPTYDDLRELRQYVAQRARSASGGDVYALRGLQHQLDSVLSKHLPEEMGGLRNQYANFARNYEWSDINKLRASATPDEATDWFVKQNRSVQHEILANATPEEQSTYQELISQKIAGNLDFNLPPNDQVALIRRTVLPYVKSGLMKELYGADADAVVRDMIYMPLNRAQVAKSLETDSGKQQWLEGFLAEAKKSGRADKDAAQAGLNQWASNLPADQQALVKRLVGPLPSGPELPVLMGPEESLAKQITTHAQRGKLYIPKFIALYGLGAGALALAGGGIGGSFMARYALGFALLTAGSAGYRTAMNLGGAQAAARMFASPTARNVGGQAFRMLTIIGGRAVHQETADQDTAAQGQ